MIYNRMNRQTDRCMYARAVQTTESTNKKREKTTKIKKQQQQRTEIQWSINEQRCHWMKFSWCLVADRASAVFNSRINNNNRKKIHYERWTKHFDSDCVIDFVLISVSITDFSVLLNTTSLEIGQKSCGIYSNRTIEWNSESIFHSKILFCDTLWI